MCHEADERQPIPSNNRAEIGELITRLYRAQRVTADRIQKSADFQKLNHRTPDGFSVHDILRMWGWHYWTHHRDLVRARGPLDNDDPHFHVPHYIREASEQFGTFIGELSCLSDEYLDTTPPGGGRTLRETVLHLLDTLENYIANEVEQAAVE